MPFYRRRRGYARRRRYSRAGLRRVSMLKPARDFRRMSYDNDIAISPSYYSTQVPYKIHSWRANSIYDPDWTGIGAVAYGYTDAAADYQFYLVRESRLSLELVPYSNSNLAWSQTMIEGNVIPIWWGITADDSTSGTALTRWQLTEDPAVKWDYKAMTQITTAEQRRDAGKLMTIWLNVRKWEGESVTGIHDDVYGAKFGANPTNQIYFNLYAIATAPDSGASNNYGTWTGHVHLDYWVEVFQPLHNLYK